AWRIFRSSRGSGAVVAFAASFAIAFIVVFSSGCSTTDRNGAYVLTSCESITNTFRGFHQQGFPTNWVCDAGTLKSIKGAGTDLITREKFKDFELTLDWKVTTRANSGILYGVSEATTDTYWSGPE